MIADGRPGRAQAATRGPNQAAGTRPAEAERARKPPLVLIARPAPELGAESKLNLRRHLSGGGGGGGVVVLAEEEEQQQNKAKQTSQ